MPTSNESYSNETHSNETCSHETRNNKTHSNKPHLHQTYSGKPYSNKPYSKKTYSKHGASQVTHDVTRLLSAWGGGDEAALDQLYPLVYEELHRLAHGRMRHERYGHTLQPTALVHEAFLRLVDQNRGGWESRGHFFAIAAGMMRRVLVDYARQRKRNKRGGDVVRLPLDEAPEIASQPAGDVLAVHDALEALATFDPRKAKMVELRFFGGLSIDEAAESLNVSPGTVMRDWTLAKAWLKRQIQRPADTSVVN